MKRQDRTSGWTSWRSTRYPNVLYRERRSNGERRYAIDYLDTDGQRHRETVAGGLQEARQALAELTSKPERPKRTKMTLQEAFEAWLDAPRRHGSLSDSSRRQYEMNFRLHVPEALKRKRLSELDEEDVLRILKGVSELNPWTQAAVFKTVSGPLRLAMRKGHIGRNPAAALLPEERPARGKARQRVLQPDEIARVLAVCPPQHLALISLAIYSGLRQSELLGLRWKNIDLDQLTVAAIDQVDKQGKLTGRTKSKPRTVYLPPQVATNLKQHWLSSPNKQPDDYVFASSTTPTRPITQEWARQIWNRVRAKAGIADPVRFHDLRHTFASILIAQGATPVELADQLGDSVTVALSTYASLFGRAQSEEKLRAILAASYPAATAGTKV